ncbi:Arabinose operon regulatory protein [Paenibacillus sp. JJ-100]|uniref:helix-turn-helix transcriptional regulator n=1 Tax=Paenibacillus sp. JJ-100 TaxID=2974896 RepID=UPI0022FF7FEE|nr:AraC family transcriptional regulator [Paenibacillus sp. JJ-100]CAI6083439.1 Arabinose operon regulatory protein [Paenibacillus sp. JJ-100]
MFHIEDDQFSLTPHRTSHSAFREVFHAHSQLELTYIHDGYGQLITEGHVFPLEPGMLMIFRPFQLHHVQIEVSEAHPFIRTVLMVDLELLHCYWPHFITTHHFIQHLLHEQPSIPPILLTPSSPLIQRMEHFGEQYTLLLPHEAAEDARLFTLDILTQLRYLWKTAIQPLNSYSSTQSADFSGHLNPHAEAAMQWIERNYSDSFSLEDIAEELHLSAYHLSHVFKKATGTSIIAYAQATRIRHACVLLSRTVLSIPEIGHRVGMPSPSYFCKVFRKATGTTPHQYRLKVTGRD